MTEETRPYMRQPFLVGDLIYLRVLEESDVNDVYLSWLNDHEVSRYLVVGIFPSTADDVRRWVTSFEDRTKAVAFAIVDKTTNQHIGNVTLYDINWVDRTAEWGTMIGRKEYWGKGYGTEARRLMIGYAFQRLGLRKITAGNVADNVASIESNKKLGFKQEGLLREQVWADGKFHDVVRLGLLRRDWLEVSGNKSELEQIGGKTT